MLLPELSQYKIKELFEVKFSLCHKSVLTGKTRFLCFIELELNDTKIFNLDFLLASSLLIKNDCSSQQRTRLRKHLRNSLYAD